MKKSLFFLFFASSVFGCSDHTESASKNATEEVSDFTVVHVVPVSQVEWEALNPARGEMSPRAGTLWGDRKAEVPTGFLAKFVDGFSSPPHIHNVTYRAVVIDGAIHNDDPNAEHMWMTPGSFWTQPEGEVHITAAKGASNIALVEIDHGPYLVNPVSEAFDNGERPVNIDASNVVWLPFSEQSNNASTPYISYLWGMQEAGQWNGSFIKLPPGFVGELKTAGTVFHGVVIQGSLEHGTIVAQTLLPGSYIGAEGASVQQWRTNGEQETIIYIRTNGLYQLGSDA